MLRERWLALPRLVRFLATHFVNGVVLGWICGLLLLWFDICRLGSLLANYDSALLTILFFAKGGLLFGTVAMSVAVMNLGDDGS